MKAIVWILLFLIFLPLSAQKAEQSIIRDREVLPKELWAAYDKAKSKEDTAQNYADSCAPALAAHDAVEHLLAAAAQYRIQRLPESEQTRILKEVYELGKDTERIGIAPRIGTGSMESCFREWEERNLLFHHIRIWTLSDPQYEQWKKIGFAKLVLEKETYQLENGISRFVRKEDEFYAWRAITIRPEFFLEYKGNLYALVTVDYRQSHSGDDCVIYFCKLGNDGILHPVRMYQKKGITTMKVTDKDIVFYKTGEYHEISIPLSEL